MNQIIGQKKIWVGIIATIFSLSSVTVASVAEAATVTTPSSELISTDYSGANDDVASVVTPEGAAVVVYPAADYSGVVYYERTPEYDLDTQGCCEADPIAGGGQWNEVVVLSNAEVDGAESWSIRDLSVKTSTYDGNRLFYMAWIAVYYDADGNFLTEKFHLYFGSSRIDDDEEGVPTMTVAAEGDIRYEMGDDGLTIIINGNDVYAGAYHPQDEWGEGPITEVDAFDSGYDAYLGNGVFLLQDETSFDLFYHNTQEASSSLTEEVSGIYLASTYYNGEEYLLYKDGDQIYMATVDSEGVILSTDTVFYSIQNIKQATIGYNDYGAGQVMVAVKSRLHAKKRLHFALQRSSGWVKQKNVHMQKASRALSLPKIHTFEDGTVRLLWKNGSVENKLQMSTYVAGATEWSAVETLSRSYGDRKWIEAFNDEPVQSTDGDQSIVRFRSHGSAYQFLTRWQLGDEASITGMARFAKDYEVISYGAPTSNTVNGLELGEFYMSVIRKGEKLRVIVEEEVDMF